MAGLLPRDVPVDWESIGAEWFAVRTLVRMLPGACVPPATFRNMLLSRLHELPLSCDGLMRQESRERGRCLLAFLAAGWHASGPAAPLPEALDRLFVEVSAALERAPQLGLTDLVLYNWYVDAPARAVYTSPSSDRLAENTHEGSSSLEDWRYVPGIPALGIVQPYQRFLCVEEEDWFCRLHVTLASGMGGVVGAIARCFAAQSVAEQVRALQLLELAIEALVKVLTVAYKWKISRYPTSQYPNHEL